jgi:hypothetical protein
LTTIDPSAASIVRGLFPLFGIGSLSVGPREFIFCKRAAPAVREIKDRHVKHEHGVVPECASSKDLAQRAPEIVFKLFGFHSDFRIFPTLTGLRSFTTEQSWDLPVPLSREQRKVASGALDC